jgi:hypothetical protein
VADAVGHAGHDRLRVAEAVDRGARLAPILDLCARCVGLYVELVALTTALPLSALPARPRSFTLTAEDARRLRPAGWRGWWSTVGSARDTLTRPLAIGITTIGLAGLLLTAAPTLLPGLGGAASSGAAGAIEADAPAASVLSGDRTLGVAGGPPETSQVTDAPSAEGPSPTIVLSVGLLLVGGGLFVVRRVAVRGPSMR